VNVPVNVPVNDLSEPCWTTKNWMFTSAPLIFWRSQFKLLKTYHEVKVLSLIN